MSAFCGAPRSPPILILTCIGAEASMPGAHLAAPSRLLLKRLRKPRALSSPHRAESYTPRAASFPAVPRRGVAKRVHLPRRPRCPGGQPPWRSGGTCTWPRSWPASWERVHTLSAGGAAAPIYRTPDVTRSCLPTRPCTT
uniref:Uncharacterized protein n=1 Tax=Ixodes ricinus TaxID=34613 RepID=A0A6B0UUJ0_IXORI